MAELSKQLVDAMKQSAESKTSAFDSIGTVRRVKDGIAYVHLAGGVDETPVQLTVDAKAGDEVQVRVSGGRAWIVGNATAPPTDNTMAKQAINYSKIANDAAQRATKDALVANEAAQSASASAREAKETTDEINAYAETAGKTITQILNDGETAGTAAQQAKSAADSAMKGLGQVEDVVGTLNWITEHSKVTTDTTPQAGKSYYIKNQDNTFTLVTDVEGKNPAQEGWYELTEAVQNYILSHLALTNDGLYVMKDGSQWKVQVADDGVYILDPNNKIANQMIGDGNIIGYEDETHAEIDYHSLQLTDKEGNVYFHVSDLRDKDDGYQATVTETYIGNGIDRGFSVNASVSEEVSAVDGSDSSNKATLEGTVYTFARPPAKGAEVTIIYKTTEIIAKAFTLGKRAYRSNIGLMSIAEGNDVTASGQYSHVEGSNTIAEGLCAHAEGSFARARGYYSHAEGHNAKAIGQCSHAEGAGSNATGVYSHTEGYGTETDGFCSHAQNFETIAGHSYQTAIGKFNDNKQNNAFEIGNGTDDNNRSNAFDVDWSGNVNASGDIEDGQGNVLSEKLQEDNNGDISITRNILAGGDIEDGQGNVLSDKANLSLFKDYIVEASNKDGWTYRKWKSGKVEAWYDYSASSTATFTTWVAPIRYKDITLSIPSGIFSAAPKVFATSRNNQSWVASVISSSATSVTVRLLTVASAAITSTFRVYATNY